MTEETKTGRTRYRSHKTFGDKQFLVLQIEERYTHYESVGNSIEGTPVTQWRDARTEDLTTAAS
jgi:hypothetical protein